VNYDDETLMAYADGELDAAERAEISAALEQDPQLARRVEQHRMLRTEVTGAFAGVLGEPVPERLVAAAKAATGTATESPARGKVVQFPVRATRAPGAPWRAREWSAMAASVLLGVAISWRAFSPDESALIAARGGALVARGALATALEKQLASDQRREDAVLIGVTFKARDGHYCRSFTLHEAKTAGLACRVGSEWQVPVATATEIPGGTLQQAAAATPPAVLQAIESRIAGDALDASGEENARLGGWDATR
jgi:hypothetical protein